MFHNHHSKTEGKRGLNENWEIQPGGCASAVAASHRWQKGKTQGLGDMAFQSLCLQAHLVTLESEDSITMFENWSV